MAQFGMLAAIVGCLMLGGNFAWQAARGRSSENDQPMPAREVTILYFAAGFFAVLAVLLATIAFAPDRML